MKLTRTAVLGLAMVFALVLAVQAASEDKTLKGTITCAKCDLKKEAKCTTVIVVKEGDKDVIYYFDEASGKKNHKEICQSPKKGTVKGDVKKDGDKMTVKVTDVKFD
jgi:hypothetical protein